MSSALLSPHPEPFGDLYLWFWAVLTVVDLGLLVAIVLRRQVRLESTVLRSRNLGRWQTLTASGIQAVTLAGTGWTARLQVWTIDQRSHACAALSAADVTVVGDWWLAHRGADWQPAWAPYPPPPAAVAWWT